MKKVFVTLEGKSLTKGEVNDDPVVKILDWCGFKETNTSVTYDKARVSFAYRGSYPISQFIKEVNFRLQNDFGQKKGFSKPKLEEDSVITRATVNNREYEIKIFIGNLLLKFNDKKEK